MQALLAGAGALRTAFQPITEIRSGRIVGYEALSRITMGAPRRPADWFAAARRAGLGVALEAKACITALRALPRLGVGQFMSVNLSPEALMCDQIRHHLSEVDPASVIIELTEHADSSDVPRQTRHITALRRRGLRLAIDDIGAGYSSLTRVLHLRPDLLKIDQELVQGCATDPMRRFVLEMTAMLAAKQGGAVVAEGVEDPADLQAIHQIGIRYVQGFLVGRPNTQPTALTDTQRGCLERSQITDPGSPTPSSIAPMLIAG